MELVSGGSVVNGAYHKQLTQKYPHTIISQSSVDMSGQVQGCVGKGRMPEEEPCHHGEMGALEHPLPKNIVWPKTQAQITD